MMKFRANSLIRSRHRFPPIVPSHVVARVLSRNSLHLPGNFPVSFTCWRREQFAPDSLLRHVVSASGCRRSLSLLLLVLPQKRPTYSKTGQRRIGNRNKNVILTVFFRPISRGAGSAATVDCSKIGVVLNLQENLITGVLADRLLQPWPQCRPLGNGHLKV